MHSQEPWTADWKSGRINSINGIVAYLPTCYQDVGHEEGRANVALIMAAPDLLHACEMVRDACKDADADNIPRGVTDIALATINAAIEKAKGR
jgi:hypothetical protein